MNPFVPDQLPLSTIDWARHVSKISQANRALARYDDLLQGIPEPNVLLSPLTTHEAVLSSKIEGTRATLGEVLKYDACESVAEESKKQDIYEIVNYRKALLCAEKSLSERKFSIAFLKEIHALLLDSVRGQTKTPGQIRTTQNWIGAPGSTIEEASFVPPDPIYIQDYLENWENFYNSEQADPLVQLAILHAQFEIIHPFNDGNGRLGRILIPLFLYSVNVLSSPMFYLSEFLDIHREVYIEKLRNIGMSSDSWDDWIEFFLTAIIEQSCANSNKVKKIMNLYSDLKDKIFDIIRSKYSIIILDKIFSTPIFNTNTIVNSTSKLSRPIINDILKKLSSSNIIKLLKKGRGPIPDQYIFPELINICKGRSVF